MTERSLIIDGTNIFYRAYVVNPSLSNSGLPVGGLVGFLKSLQKLIREMKPTKVFVCWDGAGGSSRRRSVVSSYKEGRKAIRLNRSTGVSLSLEEENQSKLRQIMRLFEYLDNLPLIQLMHDGVEADDMISILCQELRGEQKIIVSSDKDFYQLLDDETIIYRPVQAVFKTKKDIVDEFQIHPNNFALARAVSGDKSDNLQGVKGAGLKTLAKRFPFLVEEKDYSLTDLVDACEETENKLKIHEGILDNYDKILKNYKIMQLYVPNVSFQVRDIVKNAKENYSRYYNKTEIVKMMFTDGFPQISWTDLFAHSNRIASLKD
jgi:DNA polymerase-1